MWNGVNDEELTRLSLFLFCFMFSNYKMMFSSKRCRQGCWSWVLCFLVPRINESFWVSKLKRVMLLGIWKTTAGRLFLKKGTEKIEKIKVNYLRVERLETRWSEERSALTTKRWIAFLRSELGEQMTGPGVVWICCCVTGCPHPGLSDQQIIMPVETGTKSLVAEPAMTPTESFALRRILWA